MTGSYEAEDREHLESAEVLMLMTDAEEIVMLCPIEDCQWCNVMPTDWRELPDATTLTAPVLEHVRKVHSPEMQLQMNVIAEANRFVTGRVAVLKAQAWGMKNQHCWVGRLLKEDDRSGGAIRYVLRAEALADDAEPQFEHWWEQMVEHAKEHEAELP